MTALQWLYLDGNQIRRLPLQIAQLEQLQSLGLSGNPLEFPPEEITSQGIDTIREYLLQASPQTAVEGTFVEAVVDWVVSKGVAVTVWLRFLRWRNVYVR